MRTIFTILMLLLISNNIKSQTSLNTAKIIQFGSMGEDEAQCVTSDNTGIYVGGTTDTLLGAQYFGGRDCFIKKFSLDGDTLKWTVQFGTLKDDDITGIAVNDSGLFVVGKQDNFPWPMLGKGDGFIRRYSKNGNLVWATVLVPPDTNKMVEVLGVGLDNDAIYISGGTLGDLYATSNGDEDCIVGKYSYTGTKIWGVQFGAIKFEEAFNLAVYQNKLYIIGTTGNALGTPHGNEDVFIVSYDTSGAFQWLKQMGTDSTEFGKSIAVDANGVYGVGYTAGSFFGSSNGYDDGYTIKLTLLGNPVWGEQFGSNAGDVNYFSATDPSGIYTTGAYYGSWKHGPVVTTEEVFIKKYAHAATPIILWETILDSDSTDIGTAICSRNNYVYSVGYTKGNLGGVNQGGTDAFLAIMNKNTGTVSINDLAFDKFGVNIYPNPFSNEIKICREFVAGSRENREVILFDVMGKEILRQNISSQETIINTEKISAGFYLLNVDGKNFKLVKGN
jgi:hypothetical protein